MPESTHPSLSPASGAESLFLAGLATANISANALAAELRRKTPSFASARSMSERSIATDDFVSAICNPDELNSDLVGDDEFDKSNTHDVIPEIDTDSDAETDEPTPEKTSRGLNFDTMPTTSVKAASVNTSMPKKDLKTPPSSSTEEPHADVATHVYEHVKGAWDWGKGLPVVSTFLGVTEAVAGKVAETAGTSLEQLDGDIIPQLAHLDADVLNPAIANLVGVLMNAAGKTEGTLKPIIIAILSPFGLIKNEAENPELTVSN